MTSFLKKCIIYALYASLVLPILFVPFAYFPWHFGKTVFFEILVELLVVAHLLERTNDGKRGSLNWLDATLIIFLGIAIVTALFGVNFANSFWGNQLRANGLIVWLHFLVWYFLIRHYLGEKGWKHALAVAAPVAFVVSLTIFFQHSLPASWQSEAAGGIIGNRAFAASYLLAAIGLAIYGVSQTYRYWRCFYGTAAIIFFFTIIHTSNRGSLVGFGAALFTAFVLAAFKLISKKARVISGGMALATTAFALFVLIWGANGPSFFKDLSFNNLFQGTGETRLIAWKIAEKAIAERPLLGWGWGNYEIPFNKYYNPDLLKFNFTETVWDKPHNWLLEIGVATGVVGVAVYLTIFIAAASYLLRTSAGDSKKTVGGVILLATLVGYFVQNLFLFETSNTLLLFFLILAIVTTKYVPESARRYHLPTIKNKTAAVLLAAIIVFVLLFVNVRSLQASYFLSQAHAANNFTDWSDGARKTFALGGIFAHENDIFLAERFTELDKMGLTMSDPAELLEAITLATRLEKSSDAHLDNPIFPIWGGQVYMILGGVDQKYYTLAEKLLLRAHAIAPQKQEVLFYLGRLYLLKKDFPQAIEYQKQAVALAPQIGVGHWFLGLSYIASGDTTHGLAEIEIALSDGYELTLNEQLYVLDIYAGVKKYDKVIEGYKKLIAADSANVNLYIKLATAYALAGDKAAALQTTETAVSLYPPLKSEADAFIKQYKLK